MLAKIQMQEAWTLLDIAQKAEATITDITDGTGPLDCEIAEGSPAQWYLVRTFPGDDVRALRWLSRRRFGVFSPQQQRRVRKEGERLVQGWESVFPGWLFVFCWNAKKMLPRIKSCPGVMDVLCDPVSGRPVEVDQPIKTDDLTGCLWPKITFIDNLRALSWVYDDRAPHPGHYHVKARRNEHRIAKATFGKKERKELHRLKEEAKRVGIWDESDWQHANELAPGKRIALLKAALMSPAVSGGSASART